MVLVNEQLAECFNECALAYAWHSCDSDAESSDGWDSSVSLDAVENPGEQLEVGKPVAFSQGDGLPQRITVALQDSLGPFFRSQAGFMSGSNAGQSTTPCGFTGTEFLAFFIDILAAHKSKLTRTSTYLASVQGTFLPVKCWAFSTLLATVMSSGLNAQESSGGVRCDSMQFITGRVMDASGHLIPAAMVVNRAHEGGGQFVDHQGQFLLAVCPGDTIAFGAIGFHTLERIAPKTGRQWDWDVRLQRLKVEVGVAEVVAPRDLREIVRDIEALGYNEDDFRLTRVDALSSPITFLYQMLSREENSKRLVAQLENRDRRHELLRELFVKYVNYEIILLQPDEFDAFIAFSDPGDELLQSWTQYEFIRYIQQRFELFRGLPSRLDDSDYQYHLDD